MADLVPQTLCSWSRGDTRPNLVSSAPRSFARRHAILQLSFWNLVECSVGRNRKVHASRWKGPEPCATSKQLGKPRPLIHQEFQTDGVHLFVELWRAGQRLSRAGSVIC